ncbi:restriction endonuclease type II-like protein [Entophlyctis helioformis]|nr:restriction endonuclease type II-like protein [Entophlyctis helioformis]
MQPVQQPVQPIQQPIQPVQQPIQPVQQPRAPANGILVNQNQRGNPVLPHIRNVPWEFSAGLVCDYEVGRTAGLLFLSLRYHRLHPEYLGTRLPSFARKYGLRIMLCVVDIDEHQQPIRELTRQCIANSITLIIATTPEEAGRYIETLKAYENKPPDLLKERVDGDYFSKVTGALTAIKSVNKTDVVTLTSSIGSFSDMAHASPEELLLLPGFGEQKVRRFVDAFTRPFVIGRDEDAQD